MENINCCSGLSSGSLLPEFIIDSDVTIIDMNSAASKLFDLNYEAVKYVRLGNALQCVHSEQKTLGCGYGDECKKCPLRVSVGECAKNSTEIHGEAQISIKIGAVDTVVDINYNVRKLPETNRFIFQIVKIVN